MIRLIGAPEPEYPANSFGYWYSKLPSGYRELALRNMKNAGLDRHRDQTKRFPHLYRALTDGFLWTRTPQGSGFWSEINFEYRRVEIEGGKVQLPEIPTEGADD